MKYLFMAPYYLLFNINIIPEVQDKQRHSRQCRWKHKKQQKAHRAHV